MKRAAKSAEKKEVEALAMQVEADKATAEKSTLEETVLEKARIEARAQVMVQVRDEIRAELRAEVRAEVQAEEALARKRKETEETTMAVGGADSKKLLRGQARSDGAMDISNEDIKSGSTGAWNSRPIAQDSTLNAARAYHASPLPGRVQGQGNGHGSPLKPKYGDYAYDEENEDDDDRSDPVVPSVYKSAAASNNLDRRNTKRFKSDGDASPAPPQFITAKEQMVHHSFSKLQEYPA